MRKIFGLMFGMLLCSNVFADVAAGDCVIPTKEPVTVFNGLVTVRPSGPASCLPGAAPAVKSGGLWETRQEFMVNTPPYPENGEFPPNSSIDLRRYNPILGTFPTRGQTAVIFVQKEQYVALEFTVPTNLPKNAYGEVSWSDADTNKGVFEVAISDKAGNFNVDSRCKVKGGYGALLWLVGDTPFGCPVGTGKTYFLNIRATQCDFNECYFYVNKAGRAG